MADNIKPADAGGEGLKAPERRTAAGEQAVHFGQEKKENVEEKFLRMIKLFQKN